MNASIGILPGSDTFVTINGCRVRLGRDYSERVTMWELSDRFARTFRELGASPLVMSDRAETVFGFAERASGDVDLYTVSIACGMVHTTYCGTVTPSGERSWS